MPIQIETQWWTERFREFHHRFAPFFFRAETRDCSRRYLEALLAPLERKTGWAIAEAIGERDPNGAQRLLYEARWDEDAVRDELEHFVAEVLGDSNGILVVDESGFPKKGTKSAGVKRQYCGRSERSRTARSGLPLLWL